MSRVALVNARANRYRYRPCRPRIARTEQSAISQKAHAIHSLVSRSTKTGCHTNIRDQPKSILSTHNSLGLQSKGGSEAHAVARPNKRITRGDSSRKSTSLMRPANTIFACLCCHSVRRGTQPVRLDQRVRSNKSCRLARHQEAVATAQVALVIASGIPCAMLLRLI